MSGLFKATLYCELRAVSHLSIGAPGILDILLYELIIWTTIGSVLWMEVVRVLFPMSAMRRYVPQTPPTSMFSLLCYPIITS